MKHLASKAVLLALLILFLNNSLSAQLYINEWMSDNDTYLADQAGEYDDWFEIYNAGTVAVNLNGYFLSDDPAEPELFQIEANISVPPGGFLLLWADKDLDQGDNHVNFKLSASGESILLSSPTGSLIHQVNFGPFPTDFSSGVFPDGSTNQIVFNEPTPSATNNGQVIFEILSLPAFDVDGGFYAQTQTLNFQLPPDAEQIFYTLNSSVPHPDSSDTFLYANPITITETTVVRAISVAPGFQNSPIASEIYYFNAPYSLPTLSIIADPEELFGPDGIHTNPFESGSAWERFCQLELFELNGGGFSIDAGIRIQGSSSVGAPKKSFRIFFEEEYGDKFLEYPLFTGNSVEEFRNIVLRSGYDDDLTTGSGTLLRDPLSTDIYDQLGGLASDRRWAVLTINGEYWGIYDIRESVNEHFIESHVGDNNFDMIRMTKFFDDLKEGSLNEWVTLRHFLNHNDCDDPEVYAEATKDIDVENLINFLAFVQVTAYNSWTWGTSVYKVDEGGKWRFTPWDMDRSIFSNQWNGFEAIEDTSGIQYNNYLPKSLIRNEGFRNQFLNRTADLLNSISRSPEMIARLNNLKNEISAEIPAELNRWAPNSPSDFWESKVENVEDFLNGRPDRVRNQAIEEYDLSGVEEITLNVNGPGTLEINTLFPETYPWSGIYFEEVPIRIKAVPNPGFAFAGWSEPGLPIEAEIEIDVKDYSSLTANFVLGNSDNLNIVINEINYHSPETTDGGDWIELYNADNAPAQLSGWTFFDESGKRFSLTDNTVLPNGEYLILAADKEAFQSVYPSVDNVIGNFGGINESGFSLSNGGELIQFINANGSFKDEVAYLDDAPWPLEADGQGPSLQLIQPTVDNALPENWAAGMPTPGALNFNFPDSQTIDFPSILNQPTDAEPIVLNAVASSGLPVSYELVNGPATINGNIVTLTAVSGTVTIRTTQAGNNQYLAAQPVSRSFEVYEKQNQLILFNTIPDQPTDAPPINLLVAANSGLPVNLELVSGPVTLNNNTLTLTGGVGTVTLRATQSGNNQYNAAPVVSRSFEVYEKEDQTISFNTIVDQPTDASPINLVATSSSSLEVSIELLDGPAMLTNNILTLTGGVGTVTVRATQAGNNQYNAAPAVTRSFEVYEKQNQTIMFAALVDQPTDASPINLVATSSSNLEVSIELLDGPAMLTNNILTLTGGVGTVTVRATQVGNNQYNAAPAVTRSFEVYEKEDQTIMFAALVDQPTDASPINLVATSSSSLEVSIELLDGPAMLTNNILTLTGGVGTVTVRATQVGNNLYNAAPAVTRSFAVYEKEDQTIIFDMIEDQPTDAPPITLLAMASSGLEVSIELLAGPAMLNNNILSLTGAEGLVTLRATQAGNNLYNAATSVTQSFQVRERENQVIIFNALADQPTDAAPLTLTAMANSGLEVSIELMSGPASLNNNILSLTGVEGTVTLRATQPGNGQYNMAPPVTRSFSVYEKENQTIAFDEIADQPTDASPINLIATSSSGLAVNIELLSGPAMLNNNILTLTGVTGMVTIRAIQIGNNFFNAALPVTRSFSVYEKENQTIIFEPIMDQPQDAAPIGLQANASSGLMVDFELVSGPAMLNNNMLSLTGVTGTVTVRAKQVGNIQYNAAPSVMQSFEVYQKEDQTIDFATIADQPTDASPVLLAATASSGLNVAYEMLSGPATLIGNTVELTGLVGVVRIRAFQNGNDFYNTAEDVIREFNVYEKEVQTIDFLEIPDQFTGATEVVLQASASSGLPVSYEVIGGPVTVSGNTLALNGLPGIVSVRAVQNGDLQFQAATPVIRSFTINEQSPQTIEITTIPNQPTTAPPVLLPTTATSGLVIQYEIVSGPATLENDNEVVLNGVEGLVTILATQPGDVQFLAASPVEVSFEVILLEIDLPLEVCTVETDASNNPYIVEVELEEIASTSENEGYANNVDQITILRRESTTPMKVAVENEVDAYISVWIDFNRNGSFADAGEVVYEGIILEDNIDPQLEMEVMVPADARIGATRMRVIAQKDDFANPCDEIYFGEVEDYGIYLEVVTNVLVEAEVPPTIYPNPFGNEITVNWQMLGYEVSVYNSIGQRIYRATTSNSTTFIDTHRWNKGIYIMKLRNKQGKTMSEILIK